MGNGGSSRRRQQDGEQHQVRRQQAGNRRPNQYPGAAHAQQQQQLRAIQAQQRQMQMQFPQARQRQQAPPQIQQTYTVKNEVNLRKETLRVANDGGRLRLSFEVDANMPFDVEVGFLACADKSSASGWQCQVQCPPVTMDAAELKQTFEQDAASGLEISSVSASNLVASADNDSNTVYPIMIRLRANRGPDGTRGGSNGIMVDAQVTLATFVVDDVDGTYGVRALLQKIYLGEHVYDLKEIYGMGSAGATGTNDQAGDMGDDLGDECVICMTNPRDTTVLPCRHMCLCNECAKIMRLQSGGTNNKCPICRTKIESLLQIHQQSNSDEGGGDEGCGDL